jgi:hypothetical protein
MEGFPNKSQNTTPIKRHPAYCSFADNRHLDSIEKAGLVPPFILFGKNPSLCLTPPTYLKCGVLSMKN